MTEQEAINHPINRRARQHLRALAVPVDDLPENWIGLAMWARQRSPENRDPELRRNQNRKDEVLEWLLSLGEAASLEWGQKSLLPEVDGQSLEPFLERQEPRKAAAWLLEHLQDQMSQYQAELPEEL